MNKKEHKEFKRSWALSVVVLMATFFAGIAINGAYGYIRDNYFNDISIFLFFGFLTLVLINYLSFYIENMRELRDKKDSKIFKMWLGNIFKIKKK